jgi:hypothetical protein
MSASGPKQTWAIALHMSAFGAKANIEHCSNVRTNVVFVLGGDASRFVHRASGRRQLARSVGVACSEVYPRTQLRRGKGTMSAPVIIASDWPPGSSRLCDGTSNIASIKPLQMMTGK